MLFNKDLSILKILCQNLLIPLKTITLLKYHKDIVLNYILLNIKTQTFCYCLGQISKAVQQTT